MGNPKALRLVAADMEYARQAERVPVRRLASYAPKTVLTLIQGERWDGRRAVFRAMALMGARAIPTLLDEMVDIHSPDRLTAVRLLRKIVEKNPGTDWDSIKGADGGRLKQMLSCAVEDEDPEVSLNAMGALRVVMRDPPGENVIVYGLPEKPAGGVLAACAAILEKLDWLRPWDDG